MNDFTKCARYKHNKINNTIKIKKKKKYSNLHILKTYNIICFTKTMVKIAWL
jgi:hypothetical protein